jgi:ribosomal protein S27AE
MMGEELARCHAGALLRAHPGRYYCARCLTRVLDTAAWTKRDARRAIAMLFRWPIGLTTALREGRDPCGDCGQVGGALLGAV